MLKNQGMCFFMYKNLRSISFGLERSTSGTIFTAFSYWSLIAFSHWMLIPFSKAPTLIDGVHLAAPTTKDSYTKA
ncbi:hypothetical protein T4A_4524 [Trichinella pseudospiralis]|uniref:Uncharacterized protein n=1 Tax=Trichinella pseudospiralis TaxID=6337 RepID=A0A0V1E6Q3_TRIPS|nr:hypothetical protein T4A_4524 [Trichinella pseudospiralis]